MERDKIKYEWCIRTFDEYGDIIDNDFDDSLGGYAADDMWAAITESGPWRLELVKYVGNDVEGVKSMEYAEISYGHLYSEFSDGYRVPKRFHAELAKVIASLKIRPEDYGADVPEVLDLASDEWWG